MPPETLDITQIEYITKTNDHGVVHLFLHELHASSHRRQSLDFICNHPSVIDRAIYWVTEFEYNDFKLFGLGCWILDEIVNRNEFSLKMLLESPHNLFNALFKIALERPASQTCYRILNKFACENEVAFENICDLGKKFHTHILINALILIFYSN